MSILRSYTYIWRRQEWQGREMGGSRHIASRAHGVFFHYYHDYIYSIYYEKLLQPFAKRLALPTSEGE